MEGAALLPRMGKGLWVLTSEGQVDNGKVIFRVCPLGQEDILYITFIFKVRKVLLFLLIHSFSHKRTPHPTPRQSAPTQRPLCN